MNRTATLKIENCLDCPHSKRIADPGSSDSFDAGDESLCCTKTPYKGNGNAGYGQPYPGRIIVISERWESRFRADAKVPDWCPLLRGAKKPLKPSSVPCLVCGAPQTGTSVRETTLCADAQACQRRAAARIKGVKASGK